MELGMRYTFHKYFRPQIEPSSEERIKKQQTQLFVIYIYTKSRKENK